METPLFEKRGLLRRLSNSEQTPESEFCQQIFMSLKGAYMNKKSIAQFRKLGRASQNRRDWQLELEMETLTPTPTTPKIRAIRGIISEYDRAIESICHRLDIQLANRNLGRAA